MAANRPSVERFAGRSRMSAENREKVMSYYRGLWSERRELAMSQHLADDYREHQYSAGFTKQGLSEFVEMRMREHSSHEVVIHHSLSDGDCVFLFVQERWGGDVDYARGELFRLASGKIAEHWGA